MRCIFCKEDSSTSKSVEHIMPESIGSLRRVLPPGVVCDKCNNYFARKVEQPVLNSPWMRNLRAWHQVPSKKGNLPSLVGHIAGTGVKVNWSRSDDGRIRLDPERKSEVDALDKIIEGGFETPVLFFIHDDVPDELMPRFLAKMGLETLAELFLADRSALASLVVEQPAFDAIREFARKGPPSANWPVSKRRIYPVETKMVHPDTGAWVQAGFGCRVFRTRRSETYFAFCLYGMEFVINLGGPSIRGYKEWLDEHDQASPLVEMIGYRLVKQQGESLLVRVRAADGHPSEADDSWRAAGSSAPE